MELLHSQQRSVFLVSGGFRPIINPVADILNISRDHVFANTILFDVSAFRCGTTEATAVPVRLVLTCNAVLVSQEAGNYAGFDAEEYTSRSGGKASAVRHIKVSVAATESILCFSHACPLATHRLSVQEHCGIRSLVMVGDGATDLEARQPGGADLFIGCGICPHPPRSSSAPAADVYTPREHLLAACSQVWWRC